MFPKIYFDNYAFRPPNAVSTQFMDRAYEFTNEGMNGKTNFQKIINGTKRKIILTFDFLNRYEWEFIQSQRGIGFVNVRYDLTDHSFNSNYLIDFASYDDGFGGGKNNVTVILTPEDLE